MLLLGIDFETTGLDTKTLNLTEVGAVLWDTQLHRPIQLFNSLIHCPEVPAEITALNGLTADDCMKHGRPLEEVVGVLQGLVVKYLPAFLVGHNCTNFDKLIFERFCTDIGVVPWIDTSVDVPFPKSITTRKLSHLAAEHGFLNPFAHRALFDTMTMLRVLSHYDIEDVARSARTPNVTCIANVSYDDREKAKARGYRWDKGRGLWIKTMKQHQVEDEAKEAGFPVKVLN